MPNHVISPAPVAGEESRFDVNVAEKADSSLRSE
jgi:hypothetical protein